MLALKKYNIQRRKLSLAKRKRVDRIRFRSFVNPLYRDTTVSRYLSDKSLKAYATIPNGFMG